MADIEQRLQAEQIPVENVEQNGEEVSVTFYHNSSDEDKEQVAEILRAAGYVHVRSSPSHKYGDKIPGCVVTYRKS